MLGVSKRQRSKIEGLLGTIERSLPGSGNFCHLVRQRAVHLDDRRLAQRLIRNLQIDVEVIAEEMAR